MTAYMFRAILISGLAIVSTHRAIAQMGHDDIDALRGLPSIYVAVEGIDEQAQSCGITEGLIRDAFLYPISQSRIRLSRNKSGPMF